MNLYRTVTSNETELSILELQAADKERIVSKSDATELNVHELQALDVEDIISKSSSESSVIPYIRRIAVGRRDIIDSDEDES